MSPHHSVLHRCRHLLVLASLLSGAALLAAPASAAQSGKAPYPISTSWPVGVQRYTTTETSSTMYNLLYHWGQVRVAANGAYGSNVTASPRAWLLENQRAGSTDVIAGVLRSDSGLISEGLRAFHFGLGRQAANGSFPGSADPFHGTAMFLAEAGPALVVLKYSPVAGSYTSEIAWQVGRIRKAAYAMVRSVGGAGKIDDRTKNHRFYEAALALGAVSVLSGDTMLKRWSTLYARKAMAMERPDGVMPEDGGHDTGYQALGLTYATRYLELVASGTLHDSLSAVIQRGEAWELSRANADGTINQQGDTRTNGCRERDRGGQCKTAFYATIFDALGRWSVIAHDSTYERRAYMVWLRNWAMQPGDVLPPRGLHARPLTIRTGDWLTVSGAGFQPLETVKVYFDGVLKQTIQCDQTGNFGGHSAQPNAHFPLTNVAPGRHAIQARGSFGTVMHTHVTVTA